MKIPQLIHIKFYHFLKWEANRKKLSVRKAGQIPKNRWYWDLCDQMYAEVRKACYKAVDEGKRSVNLLLYWDWWYNVQANGKYEWKMAVYAVDFLRACSWGKKLPACRKRERNYLLCSLKERMRLDGFPRHCVSPYDADVRVFAGDCLHMKTVLTGETNYLISVRVSW